jgi:2-polyprenyl-6-methoxyphenol hydroxylase-like FAD-dependent oxidoreductase
MHLEVKKVLNPLRRWTWIDKNGKEIGIVNLQPLEAEHGTSLGGALRHQLIEVLSKPLLQDGVLLYSAKVINVSQDKNSATVKLADGREFSSDLVVCADGIHNLVGKSSGLGEQEDPVFSKENIFYGTVTNFSTRQRKHPVLRDGEFRMLQGFSKSSEFVFIWSSRRQCSVDGHLQIASSSKTKRDVLLRALSWRMCSTTGLFYRKARTNWYNGRAVLLGDAAHATLPFAGQGANMVIEDGYELSRLWESMGSRILSCIQATLCSSFE